MPFVTVNNYDCSEEISPQGDLVAGTNYTIAYVLILLRSFDLQDLDKLTSYTRASLADPLNRTAILALSEPFEIKPYGSTWPARTLRPKSS